MFASTKAALASAASLSRHLGLPGRAPAERVQASRAGDRSLEVIAVRTALRRAGIDPDGEDAERLYRWATTTDERDDFDDELDDAEPGDDYQRAHERGRRERARLAELVGIIGAQLLDDDLVRRPPKLELIPVAWRVHEDEQGRRRVHLTTDPYPDDCRDRAHAQAIADRVVKGPVTSVAGAKSLKAEQWVARWRAGEWRTLTDLDRDIAAHTGLSKRQAARIRAGWGLTTGRRGRPPKSEIMRGEPT